MPCLGYVQWRSQCQNTFLGIICNYLELFGGEGHALIQKLVVFYPSASALKIYQRKGSTVW